MLIDLIEKRWSPRAFSNQEIAKPILENIFLAASRAPSCFNEQPWRFIVGLKNQDTTWQRIFDSLGAPNKIWTENVPVLAVVVAKTTFTQNSKPNVHAWYDCGQAVAFMTSQATHEGLYMHQMAGFDTQKVVDSFDIPAEYQPIAVLAIGYEGNPATLPEKLQATEFNKKDRKPIAETVFSDWGDSLKF